MTKKTIALLIAVMFIGTSLMAPALSNAQCVPCEQSCQNKYDDAKNRLPALDNIMDAIENGDIVPPMDAACYGRCFSLAIGVGVACIGAGMGLFLCGQNAISYYLSCIMTCFDTCVTGC